MDPESIEDEKREELLKKLTSRPTNREPAEEVEDDFIKNLRKKKTEKKKFERKYATENKPNLKRLTEKL